MRVWRWWQLGASLSSSTQWGYDLGPGCDPPEYVLFITILLFLLTSLCCVPGMVPSLHVHSFCCLILIISCDTGVMTTILKILKERFKTFKHLSQYHKTGSSLHSPRAPTAERVRSVGNQMKLTACEPKWLRIFWEKTYGLLSPVKKIFSLHYGRLPHSNYHQPCWGLWEAGHLWKWTIVTTS